MKNGVIFRIRQGFFRYQAWPTVCRGEDGRLYAVCSGERVSHVCPFGKSLLFSSDDGGESWSLPMIANDTWMDDRDAGICSLQGGGLMISYFHHPTRFYRDNLGWIEKCQPLLERDLSMCAFEKYSQFTEEMDTQGSFVIKSWDGGKNWTFPVRVPVSSPHGPIQCRDGRLLWLGKEWYTDLSEYKNEILLAESLDNGDSWHLLSKIPIPEGVTQQNFYEPDILELPNGTLLGAIRAQGEAVYRNFTIYFCRSEDGGKTWSVPKCSMVSGSPPHLLLLSDHRILCSYARREAPFGIRAIISEDGGETFGEEIEICRVTDRQTEGDFGYPSTVELDDGTLLTVYYSMIEGDDAPSILYTKWKLKE